MMIDMEAERVFAEAIEYYVETGGDYKEGIVTLFSILHFSTPKELEEMLILYGFCGQWDISRIAKILYKKCLTSHIGGLQ